MTYEQKKIVESSTFSLLSVYLNFFLGLLSTFSIARIVTPEEWGYLILAESFIMVAVFFCGLIPPGAEGSIDYYIPHLKSLNNNKNLEVRNFIFHNYKIRSLSSITGFVVYIIIILFSNLNLTLYQISLLISPKIFLNLFQNLNIAVFTGFQKFKIMFVSVSIHTFTVSVGNFLLLLIDPPNAILYVSFVNLLGLLTTTIFSSFFVSKLIPPKPKNKSNQKIHYNKEFYKLHKTYGLPLVITGIVAQLGNLSTNLLFLAFGFVQYITYFRICDHAVSSTLKFSSSERSVQTAIFAGINYEKQKEKFEKLFYQFYKYLSIIVALFTGLLFFLIKVYISIIYSDVYIIIIPIIQIHLFQTFSRLINRNLLIIAYSTNNTKVSAYYAIIQSVNNFIATFIALAFFDLISLAILYLLASYLLNILTILLIKRIVGFNLKLTKIYSPLIIFLVSFMFTFAISNLLNIQFFTLNLLNDILNGGVNFLILLIIFHAIIYLTKYITREEVDQIVNILPIGKLKSKLIQKIIEILSLLFPTRKSKNL